MDERALNVLAGLTGDSLTRLEEAAKYAADKGDPAALVALKIVLEAAERGDFVPCDCDDCGQWNGVSRRCSCGNRRVAWSWDGKAWSPEVY